MEAAVFFALVFRLPAYQGVMAAVVAREQREGSGGRTAAKYERNSAMANNARVASRAPAATASQLQQLNAQLGGWFSHRTVKADG
jgi:hypothetical protein